jgi:hypothetical protein
VGWAGKARLTNDAFILCGGGDFGSHAEELLATVGDEGNIVQGEEQRRERVVTDTPL